jgi:uncharacterized protein YajQ (UPF0234 family)
MAGEISFDVVSDFDPQELRNALDQVRRETGQRYDFKGATVDIEQGKDEVTLVTDDEFRARAIRDLIESKAVRRGLDLKVFEWGPIEEAGGNKVRQQIGLRRGLDDPLAKRISADVATHLLRLRHHVVPRDRGGARGRAQQGHQHPQRGGLARAVGPEEADHLALGDVEVHPVDGLDRLLLLALPGLEGLHESSRVDHVAPSVVGPVGPVFKVE